jgi:hypothetical protein
MDWLQKNIVILFMVNPMFASLANANEADLSCALAKSCSDKLPSVITAKISACEAVVASSQCQSLGPDVKLRDCKSEAFCPYTLDQSYVVGCLIGAKDSVVDLVSGIVTAPIKLFKHAIVQTKFEAKYFNSSVYQACKDAEETVTKDPAKSGLDCEQNFWHAACPRTLVRNCKDSLLEEFPDIKKSYGSNYQDVKYDTVLSDVHKRLQLIAKAKPTLVSFLQNHSVQSLNELVVQSLERQGYKFTCMSSYDVSHFSCDVVIQAFTLIAGGYGIAAKLGKPSKAIDGLKAAPMGLAAESTAATSVTPPNFSAASKIRNFSKNIFKPINRPSSIHVDDVLAQTSIDLKALEKMGVKFSKSYDPTSLNSNVKIWKITKLETSPEQLENYGKVLNIDKLPPPGTATGPKTNAFFHPEMARHKAELEQMGYRLTVDTSIPFTGAGAYHWSYTKVVSLRPDSTWQTFLHEFQHAEFSHYLKRSFSWLESRVSSGSTLHDSMSPQLIEKLGTDRVKRLETLLKRGVPQNAINETLSVDAELRAMGFRRYIPGLGTGAKKYALRHQITDLNKIAESGGTLTTKQSKTLSEAKIRYAALLAYEVGGPVAVGPLVGTGVGMGANAYVKYVPKNGNNDPNSYLQIIYDDVRNVFAQRQDGSWVKLQKK